MLRSLVSFSYHISERGNFISTAIRAVTLISPCYVADVVTRHIFTITTIYLMFLSEEVRGGV